MIMVLEPGIIMKNILINEKLYKSEGFVLI